MQLLQSRRFAVASYGIAAAYAGWLLRQYGAAVAHSTALDAEGIGQFLCEGASLDPEPALSLAGARTLITDAPVTPANRKIVASLATSGTVVWITPWGLDEPFASWPASDLSLFAAGGWMAAVGEPGRPPLAPPGSQGRFIAGLFAAVEALATGPVDGKARGLVDISVAEAVLATTIYDAVAFQYFGAVRERVGRRFSRQQPIIATLPCRDGWISLHAALHSQWVALCDLIGHPELVRDRRFADPGARAANVDALDAYLEPWLSLRTRREVYEAFQAARIPASTNPTIPEVLSSPQLAARGFWREATTASGKKLTLPGPPARVVSEGRQVPDRAGRVATGPWGVGKLRVVDLSMGWAGPLVSHVLACHGAEVIKIESHRRFDWWRGSRPPGDDPELALHERSHVFNGVNRGKGGVTLDLLTPEGHEIATRLIRDADVVVENFAPGTLERLGLTYETLSAENPALVMLRLPAFGSSGPEARHLAFGNTIEGMSGLTSLIGYGDGGPPYMLSNALGDPVGGLNGTLAVLSALAAREADGRGRCIEVAQLEAFLPLLSEAIIEYQLTGRLPEPSPAGLSRGAIRGVFRCAGDDRWLALDATTTEHLGLLADLFGVARSELDERIVASRISGLERDEIARRLLDAGIPAAPVHDEPGVLAFEPFVARGFWLPEDRDVVGSHLYPSLPVLRDGVRLPPGTPAPLLGEHNAEVLARCGLDSGEIERLGAVGVIGRQPAFAN